MTNLASVLKSEISRLAKRETKEEIKRLKTAASSQRGEIAALKKRTLALEQMVRRLSKTHGKADKAPAADATPTGLRFSPTRLAAQRKRLELSASDFGKLVDASGQSVYKWESGKVRPQAKQLAAIAKVRALGKREVAAMLLEMTG